MYRIIASDMDGTFLDGLHAIAQPNLRGLGGGRGLARLHELGPYCNLILDTTGAAGMLPELIKRTTEPASAQY